MIMSNFYSVAELAGNQLYKEGDIFVLCGELFGRGYANGLVNEAKKRKMKIIGFTVGRRDSDKTLRPLNDEELAISEANLGGKIINIPMEAGFDMETVDGVSPVDMLQSLKQHNWDEFNPDEKLIDACREKGKARFNKNLQQVIAEISKEIKPGANVHFAHTMAGGIPRSKIILVLANRVFKSLGERYIPSEKFWNSGIGMIVRKSFEEVTADTFKYLLDGTSELRNSVIGNGGQVRYTAYGYHGTEIYINGKYQWQTYTPYQQGHAKKRLEVHAENAWKEGIKATVYNCPEIRTNSSDIFIGVELSLFPLLDAMKVSGSEELYKHHFKECASRLKEGSNIADVIGEINNFQGSGTWLQFQDFNKWPMENTLDLAEIMIGTSERITDMHVDKKNLISDYLSSLIIDGTGPLIFNHSDDPKSPVGWLGHNVIAAQLNKLLTQ